MKKYVLLLTIMLLFGVVGARAADAYAYYDPSDKSLNFCYDGNKSSRSKQYTVFNLNTGTNNPAWGSIASQVEWLYFYPSFKDYQPTTCYKWAYDMTNLKRVSFNGLNTSKVTNMSLMFYNCKNLTSLDVSGFDTANVTNMDNMFGNCSSLTSINVSGFYTAKVTNMTGMFWGCSGLTSLYVSNFNTANVTTMHGMFYGCSKLTSLDLSSFNTANVTSMYRMFRGCSNLVTLKIDSWVTSKLTDMNNMFYGCSKLTSLDLSSFSFNRATSTQNMLNSCSSLKELTVPATAGYLDDNACSGVGTQAAPCTLIYPAGFTPEKTSSGSGWYMWKDGYFEDVPRPYAVLNRTTLTFYYDNLSSSRTGTVYEMNTESNFPGWYRYHGYVTRVVFDSSFDKARPTSCYYWFYGMSKITGITGLNYLNTMEVINYESMFEGCTNLESVDLSGFISRGDIYWYGTSYTLDLISFKNMFKDCTSLASIDLSNLLLFYWDDLNDDTSGGYYHKTKYLYCETDNMFGGCTALKKLSLPFTYEPQETTGEGFGNITIWDDWETMNDMAATTCQGVGTQSSPCELVYPSWFTPEKTSSGNGWYMWKGGYFKDASSGVIGDANGDGDVSVTDVLITVDYVLGNNPAGFIFANANVNGDKDVTITDVTAIVDIVLKKQSAPAVTNSRESVADAISLLVKDGHATVVLDNSEPFCAMQFTVTMPEGAGMGNIAMAPARSNGHQVLMRQVAPGRYNVVVYANSGAALRDGSLPLLRFDIAGCQANDITIGNVQLVNSHYETVVPTGVLTGISITEIDSDNGAQPYYNTVGIGTNTPTRGIYIRNGKKVVVK